MKEERGKEPFLHHAIVRYLQVTGGSIRRATTSMAEGYTEQLLKHSNGTRKSTPKKGKLAAVTRDFSGIGKVVEAG